MCALSLYALMQHSNFHRKKDCAFAIRVRVHVMRTFFSHRSGYKVLKVVGSLRCVAHRHTGTQKFNVFFIAIVDGMGRAHQSLYLFRAQGTRFANVFFLSSVLVFFRVKDKRTMYHTGNGNVDDGIKMLHFPSLSLSLSLSCMRVGIKH